MYCQKVLADSNNNKYEVAKKLVLEFLDFLKYKVENDLLTMDDIDSIAKECVRGRGRVVVGQEVEVPGTHMGELAHVDVVLTAAEVGEKGDREEVGD